MRCVIELKPMMGMLRRASSMAKSLPSLECSRLCTRRRRHSDRVRSPACTARRVWWLIVNGLGKQYAIPFMSMTVMSSDRNSAPCSRSIRSTVPVLPVSVRADSKNPCPFSSMHAECRQNATLRHHEEPQQTPR